MSAFYDTRVSIQGTPDELVTAMSMIIDYDESIRLPRRLCPTVCPDVYFHALEVSCSNTASGSQEEKKSLSHSREDEIQNFLKELPKYDRLYITADGPYGDFWDLARSVTFFHELAYVIPDATFSGSISGGDSGGNYDEQEAQLKDGKLIIINRVRSTEWYWANFQKKLPWDTFAELFNIDKADESDVDIDELVYFYEFPDTYYKNFLSVCKTAKISEEEYDAALKKVRALGVGCHYDWLDERQTVHDPRTWDPDQKKYIEPED